MARMEVHVHGTGMDPRHYDPRDWTPVLRAQTNHRATRNTIQTTNADASRRETRTHTQDAATAPALNSSSTQLCILRTVAQKIKQLPHLPKEGYKVVFWSQGGLELTTLQPRNHLNAFTNAAALTEPSTLQLRIHPVNNTCTVSVANQDDALKLVQLQKTTYDERQYAMAAYIAPPDGSVRGVITNPYWKESPQEILCDLVASNQQRNCIRRSTDGADTVHTHHVWSNHRPPKIVYGGGLHLCTPYTPKVKTCSNCCSIGHRTDVCVQPRTHKCPRCGLSHPMDETTTCKPVCIICQGPHLTASRDCKHRHQPRTKQSSERQAMYRRRVENKSPHPASTKRTEAHEDPHAQDSPRVQTDRTGLTSLKHPR
ncbi:hypothetical protein HPB50_012885 [Hyalomma asiaticum]|uniref:Uncharacterized protein n=1 Tax=Hyalomma asiaticum TaxID=266040 RepID=A0ACB7S6F1_HYAAI|nr:hypothetical protein HPB50_012885 [Hyalomma asiaticum]